MKCAILSTLLVGAAAFAPAQTGKASTALSADLTAEVGAQAPLGCFDPLGVLGDPKDGDQEQFDQLRYIELKHGRVAMLAFTGYIVTYVSYGFLLVSLFDSIRCIRCEFNLLTFGSCPMLFTSQFSAIYSPRPAFDSLVPRIFPLDLLPFPSSLAWFGPR